MLVTLYLISANVYNVVDAPPGRGFSYIELWMVGMQFPILFALVEYSIILGIKKYFKYRNESKSTTTNVFSLAAYNLTHFNYTFLAT